MTLTELAESRAQTLNDIQGTLGEIDCPICKNKGYVASVVNGVVTTRKCACMTKRNSIMRIRKSGLMDLLNRYTLEAYQTPEKWQEMLKKTAISFVSNSAGRWFMISGNPGSGKTHLCTGICGKLIDGGKDVQYMLWRTDAPHLKALVNDREQYETEMYRLKSVDVLYIDDFFKGTITEADINLAFDLLNARYNNANRTTIISAEKSMEQILHIDEAVGSRIYERAKGYTVKTSTKNWRLGH